MDAGELPPYLSVTQITTYLGCPRKFYLRYVAHVEPGKRGADLALGSAVHGTIEWWMAERREGRAPDLEATLRTFRIDMHAQTATGEYAFEEKTPEEYASQGAELLRLFVERFASEPPMQGEERFEVFLTDPETGEPLPVPLVGYFDLVTEAGIDEVKTAARKSSPDAWGLQLAAYSYAWRQTRGTRPKVRVIQLVKTKVPKIEVEDADVSERDEAWFCEVAVAAYGSILAGCFHPSPSHLCARCEYWRACRRAA